MPRSQRSIPDSRAHAIHAIAGNSTPHSGSSTSYAESTPQAGSSPLRTGSSAPHVGRSTPARTDVPALSDQSPVLGLIDLDAVDSAFERLTTAFASECEVLHAVACKAVPLPSLLRRYAAAGAGCEVASPGELELALAAGFAPERIVFDSPAKTWAELHRAVELGVSINIDNFTELARLDTLLDEHPSPTSARIGFRINPQSGTGAIGALSTATQTSKFGLGLADPGTREALIEAHLARPWLNQIHVHSGSQGISLDKAAVGIRAAVDLAAEINTRAAQEHGRGRQITRIDIGGGLSVNFEGEDITPTFADYRRVLETQVPELFDFDIVTEFGRALLAKAGTILTRVEYAKTTGGRRIAMTHAGVQVATRTAYAPADWPLRILPFTPAGAPKIAEAVPTDVAGPACFSGDLLARDRTLPRLDAGDLIAVPETGAYYFSNPFSYNLLPRVPVYGYRSRASVGAGEEGALEFFLIRRGQTIDEVLAEAGEPQLCALSPDTVEEIMSNDSANFQE